MQIDDNSLNNNKSNKTNTNPLDLLSDEDILKFLSENANDDGDDDNDGHGGNNAKSKRKRISKGANKKSKNKK